MLNTQKKIWNATLYLRLSRDDGDKEESGSITGQRELLRDYISQHPELREPNILILPLGSSTVPPIFNFSGIIPSASCLPGAACTWRCLGMP